MNSRMFNGIPGPCPYPSCDDQKFPHCQISPAGKIIPIENYWPQWSNRIELGPLAENPGCSDVLHITPLSVTSVLPALVGEQWVHYSSPINGGNRERDRGEGTTRRRVGRRFSEQVNSLNSRHNISHVRGRPFLTFPIKLVACISPFIELKGLTAHNTHNSSISLAVGYKWLLYATYMVQKGHVIS